MAEGYLSGVIVPFFLARMPHEERLDFVDRFNNWTPKGDHHEKDTPGAQRAVDEGQEEGPAKTDVGQTEQDVDTRATEEPRIVVVTASRYWNDFDTMVRVLIAHIRPCDLLVHGGCPGGDWLADHIGRESIGCRVHCERAEWHRYGLAAGPIRNRKMLNMQPHVVLAFHPDLKKSRGTKDCVEEAERRGIPWILFRGREDA